jgi:hypothetical protein
MQRKTSRVAFPAVGLLALLVLSAASGSHAKPAEEPGSVKEKPGGIKSRAPEKPDSAKKARTAKPDLVITRFGSSRSTLRTGERVKLQAVVSNAGSRRVVNASVVFYLGDKPIGEEKRVTLGAKESSQIVTSFVPTRSGRFEIRVRADPSSAIDEANERNNIARTTVIVTKAPEQRLRRGGPGDRKLKPKGSVARSGAREAPPGELPPVELRTRGLGFTGSGAEERVFGEFSPRSFSTDPLGFVGSGAEERVLGEFTPIRISTTRLGFTGSHVEEAAIEEPSPEGFSTPPLGFTGSGAEERVFGEFSPVRFSTLPLGFSGSGAEERVLGEFSPVRISPAPLGFTGSGNE